MSVAFGFDNVLKSLKSWPSSSPSCLDGLTKLRELCYTLGFVCVLAEKTNNSIYPTESLRLHQQTVKHRCVYIVTAHSEL